jgi:hypothetical protein
VTFNCCGAVCAVASPAPRLRRAAARLLRALLGDGDRPLRGDDLRLRRIGRRAGRVGRRHRRVELLLRDLVLLHQSFQPLDVARGLGRGRFLLARPRLRRHEVGLRHLDLAVRAGHRGFRLLHAAGRGVDAGPRLDLRDRHVGAGGRRVGLRVGEFRLRLLDRHFVVARIDLYQHGAGADGVVVVDVHLQHRPADTGRDLRDPAVDLRVVGRFVAARAQPEDQDHRHYHHRRDGGHHALPHYWCPPR